MPRLSSINIARWRTGLDKHNSVQLCNSLIFHFLDATPLAALGGCGSRERFDLRGHASYFLILFRSSTDWWWENERWSVVGNYTVKQNLLHIYIYIVRCCNSLLIVFHGGCQDYRRLVLATILPDEGLDWPSMILSNSATLWFFTFWMPLLLLHSEDAEVAKDSICEDIRPIF